MKGENYIPGFWKVGLDGKSYPTVGKVRSLIAKRVKFVSTDDLVNSAIELSECPCDPRRRHERLGQKVAVV